MPVTKIYKARNKIRKVSSATPKSVIAPIPAVIRDIMEFQHGTKIEWTVYTDENGNKFIKINEIKD